MKTLSGIAVLVVFVSLTAGCATVGGPTVGEFYKDNDNAITGGTAGAPIGYAVAKMIGASGGKGLLVGATLGAGLGMLEDRREMKYLQEAKRATAMVGGDSAAKEARLRGQTNVAFAEKKRRECEAEYGAYAEAGLKLPHDCRQVRDDALADARFAADTNSPEVYNQARKGGYGYGAYSNRERARRHAENQAYWREWPAFVDRYNRRNGYYW